MFVCMHCQSERKNKNSLSNHERLCKLNPFRKLSAKSDKWKAAMKNKSGGGNQYTKAKETGIPYILKEETKQKLRIANIGKTWSEERRKKHSESMKKAVANNPESYTSSNRGRTKQIIVDGIKFQGKWELDFYNYCKCGNIAIERSNEWFEYEWNGTRKYFPDFYLPDHDLYIEVKGYVTDRDLAKWRDFPRSLRVIKKEDIDLIRKDQYNLFYKSEV